MTGTDALAISAMWGFALGHPILGWVSVATALLACIGNASKK